MYTCVHEDTDYKPEPSREIFVFLLQNEQSVKEKICKKQRRIKSGFLYNNQAIVQIVFKLQTISSLCYNNSGAQITDKQNLKVVTHFVSKHTEFT